VNCVLRISSTEDDTRQSGIRSLEHGLIISRKTAVDNTHVSKDKLPYTVLQSREPGTLSTLTFGMDLFKLSLTTETGAISILIELGDLL